MQETVRVKWNQYAQSAQNLKIMAENSYSG